ncbi:unnamed protein product [Allacma fusca]|uniref:Uncharacterized protein n=1 Tax=Allacma fusca TaxID=39272 RepID=A0A8J2JUD5_9HEXA|nr:unnamed protein product [Allacma fusca]
MDKSTVECTVVSANNNDVSKQNGISKSESECIGGSTDNFNASEKNCNSKSVSECAGTSSNNSEVSQNSLKSNLNFKTSDSEEIQVIKETISPQKKRFEVINLEDVLEDDDDDCVEIKMENVPSKNPISSFKQQGSWPPGCKSPIVKSSALMQVLKTDNNKEVCIIDDEDDYQQVTIHFSSSRSKKSKGLDQENHEIILIDDDDQDCIDSGKARREDNYSDNTKSRFGSCDFETRSSQSENRERNQAVYRNATKSFTVEMNQPRQF